MADAINSTGSPSVAHAMLGAKLARLPDWQTFERERKRKDEVGRKLGDYRSSSKAGNFGFPGGMGEAKLVLAKRREPGAETIGPDGRVWKGLRFCILIGGESACGKQKVTEWKDRPIPPTCLRCLEEAKKLRQDWFDVWPENREYFNIMAESVDKHGYLQHHVDGTIRGGVEFTQACNGLFQNLSAQGAKAALRRAARECWDRTQNSPLFGTRVIAFFHDELFGEVPIDRSSDAMARLRVVMVEEMQKILPDVKVDAEPALMRDAWAKGAEPVYNNGRLVPWESA